MDQVRERQSKPISEVAKPDGKYAVFRRRSKSKRAVFTAAHATLESAQDEALRLAMNHLDVNTTFYVAHVVCSVKTRDGRIVAG